MDIQQQINFQLKEKMDKLGVSFAFPTQTIHFGSSNNNENYFNKLSKIDSKTETNQLNSDKIN
jgi:hypothetical protein